MELRQLRLFVAIAEEGSIHGGARRLQMAQPPASLILKRLESQLGGELFQRSSRGVELTEAGRHLLEHAREILFRVDGAVESVRGITVGRRQTLRVGLISGAVSAGELTAPILSEFRSRHPEVDLEVQHLSFAAQFDAVAVGAVDVALVRGPFFDDRIDMMPLFSEPRWLCCSAEHPLTEREELGVNDVLDYPMMELTRTPAVFREFWQLNEVRGGPPPRAHADPAVSLLEVAATMMSSQVVMPIVQSAWRFEMASALLQTVPLVGVPPSEAAVAYPSANPDPYALAFAQCARAVCERHYTLVEGAELLPA